MAYLYSLLTTNILAEKKVTVRLYGVAQRTLKLLKKEKRLYHLNTTVDPNSIISIMVLSYQITRISYTPVRSDGVSGMATKSPLSPVVETSKYIVILCNYFSTSSYFRA